MVNVSWIARRLVFCEAPQAGRLGLMKVGVGGWVVWFEKKGDGRMFLWELGLFGGWWNVRAYV